jgi:hypothetical protein
VVSDLVICILKMRKLTLGEIKQLIPDLTADEWTNKNGS